MAVVPVAGVLTSAAILLGLIVAILAMFVIWLKSDRTFLFDVSALTTILGLIAAVAQPLVFITAWLVVMGRIDSNSIATLIHGWLRSCKAGDRTRAGEIFRCK